MMVEGKHRFGNDNRWPSTVLALLLALTLSCLLLPSCREKTGHADATAPAFAYEKIYNRDEAEVRLQLDRQSLNVAESGQLIITVTCPEQWPPKIYPPDTEAGGLNLIEAERREPSLVGYDRIRSRAVYTVQPFLPGEETIAPIRIRFARPDSELEIVTEPVTLNVISLLPDNEKATLNDIAPPMAMASHSLLYIAAGGLLLAMALFVWWRLTKKSKKKEVPLPQPPHRKAHQALDLLVARGLLEKGELSLFFKHLADILRHYIEERFSVRAPEQTTEEFLQAISAMPSFRQMDKELLQDFLTHCDLVKFARHEPTIKQGQDRLLLCRRFIDETAVFETDQKRLGGSL